MSKKRIFLAFVILLLICLWPTIKGKFLSLADGAFTTLDESATTEPAYEVPTGNEPIDWEGKRERWEGDLKKGEEARPKTYSPGAEKNNVEEFTPLPQQ